MAENKAGMRGKQGSDCISHVLICLGAMSFSEEHKEIRTEVGK